MLGGIKRRARLVFNTRFIMVLIGKTSNNFGRVYWARLYSHAGFCQIEIKGRGSRYAFRLMTVMFGSSPGYLLGFQTENDPNLRTSKRFRRSSSEMVNWLK